MLVVSVLHTSTSRIAAAHISLSVVASTQQAVSFSPAISSARSGISSINAHHTRLIFRSIWSVRKLFYTNIFLMKFF